MVGDGRPAIFQTKGVGGAKRGRGEVMLPLGVAGENILGRVLGDAGMAAGTHLTDGVASQRTGKRPIALATC